MLRMPCIDSDVVQERLIISGRECDEAVDNIDRRFVTTPIASLHKFVEAKKKSNTYSSLTFAFPLFYF